MSRPMRSLCLGLLAIALAGACVPIRPADPPRRNTGIPEGPGLFTGEAGELVILTRRWVAPEVSPAAAAGGPVPRIGAPMPPGRYAAISREELSKHHSGASEDIMRWRGIVVSNGIQIRACRALERIPRTCPVRARFAALRRRGPWMRPLRPDTLTPRFCAAGHVASSSTKRCAQPSVKGASGAASASARRVSPARWASAGRRCARLCSACRSAACCRWRQAAVW
jgi:hypothetical protein